MFTFRRPSPSILAIALVILGACSDANRLNLLIVTFDTTRADHIGCYGNRSISTPHLDRLAAEGARFEHAYAAVPITLPSHTTLMTGAYPTAHGVRDNGSFVVTDEQTTLAEILGDLGWSTAAAIGSFPLTSQFGLDQGFDLYDETLAVENFDHLGRRTRPKSGVFFDERRAEQVNEALVPWLDAHHDRPFFAWVHYFDAHQPHRPPPPYDQLYADDLYDGEIAYADECFGALRRELERRGAWDRTIVVFASDHGEGLGEHREQTHSFLNYNSTLHVPLIIRMPGRPGGSVITDLVSLADVAPTLLDLVGIAIPDSMQGRSLAPSLAGGEPMAPAPLYAETLSPRLSNGWGELRTLFAGDLKYIHGPRPELFNLITDPRELENLAQVEPDTAAAMRRQLAEFIADHSRNSDGAAIEVDDHTREQLEALGYVPSTAASPSVGEERLRDDGTPPQDRVADVSEGSELRHLLQRGRFDLARKVALALVSRDPDNPKYLEQLATAEMYGGHVGDAARTIERLNRAHPDQKIDGQMLLELAAALYTEGDHDQAIAMVAAEREDRPTAPAHYLFAVMSKELGRTDQWWEGLSAAVAAEPGYAPARVDLAVAEAERGDAQRAETELRAVIAEQPYFERAHFNIGALMARHGRLIEAEGFLSRAVQLDPHYQEAWRALVIVQLELDRREAAGETVDRIERLMPGSRLATETRGWLS